MTKTRAKLGDRISFYRKELSFTGVVEIVRDNSVIIEMSREAAQALGYETTKTVVKHSNYEVLTNASTA